MKRFGTVRSMVVLLTLLVVAVVLFGGWIVRSTSASKRDNPKSSGQPVVVRNFRFYKHAWTIPQNGRHYGIAQNFDGSFVIFVGSTFIDPKTSVPFGYATVTITIVVIGAGMVYVAFSFLRRKRALQEELPPQPYAPR